MGASDTTEKDWEEHYLELMNHFDDTISVHTTGLEEGIRCALCKNEIKSDRGCDGGCVVNEDDVARICDVIKNNRADRWIPVTERLPEDNTPVICIVKNTTIAGGRTYMVGSCDKGFWFLNVGEIGIHSFSIMEWKVTHWMPLLEMPKEE